jgi:O-antigen/teichoic acid export membrane protein
MFDAVTRKLRYLRLRPFDTSTEAGRQAERYRQAALGATANLAFRAAAALAVILGVRLTAPWLGAERFGVWATFASLVTMLSFLDLGVGNALVNRVASARARAVDAPPAGHGEASARRVPASERAVISGGLAMLVAFALASAALLALAAWLMPWHRVFSVDNGSALAEEARCAAFVFAALFALHLFGSGVLKVLIGQQRMHVAHTVSAACTLVSCLTLWWASSLRVGVPALLAAGFGVQLLAGWLVLPSVLASARGTASRHGAAPPDPWRAEAVALLRGGSLFLVLQIGSMIAWGADSLILATTSGAAAVAVYAVGQRLLQFASQPFGVFNAPLWPAYADAHARHDRAFLRHALGRSLRWTCAGSAVIALVLALAGPSLVPWWTGGAITVPWHVLGLFAVWSVVEATGNALAMYLNGTGIVRQQVVVVLAFCVLAIPAKAAGAWWGGVGGLLAASLASYMLAVVLPYATVFRRDILEPLNRR